MAPTAYTPRELFLLSVITNAEEKITFDVNAVMAETGMKSVGGVRNKFSYLQKDYKKAREDGTLVVLAGPTTSSTGPSAVVAPITSAAASPPGPPTTTTKTPRKRNASATEPEVDLGKPADSEKSVQKKPKAGTEAEENSDKVTDGNDGEAQD